MADIRETISRPVGPLPAWAWVVVFVGGYFGYKFLSGRTGGSSTTTTVGASGGTTSDNNLDMSVALNNISGQLTTISQQLAGKTGTGPPTSGGGGGAPSPQPPWWGTHPLPAPIPQPTPVPKEPVKPKLPTYPGGIKPVTIPKTSIPWPAGTTKLRTAATAAGDRTAGSFDAGYAKLLQNIKPVSGSVASSPSYTIGSQPVRRVATVAGRVYDQSVPTVLPSSVSHKAATTVRIPATATKPIVKKRPTAAGRTAM